MEVDPWELLILRLSQEISDAVLPKLAVALRAPATSTADSLALLKWLVSVEQGQLQPHHPMTRFRFTTIQRLRVAFADDEVGLSNLICELDTFSTQFPALVHSVSSTTLTGVLSTLNSEAPGVLSHARGVLVPSVREKNLFDFLLEVNKLFNLGCTLRVSGGWVRDKLMGAESDDIDVALDRMYGKDFAEKVNQHLATKHFETHKIGVIKQNPDQSKHLETATMKIFDIWVDFVHLRSESYSDDSRIPVVKFGTPQEDAMRRDLTINALFYNLNEDKVEDSSGKGLHDLQNRIIRTPLPPLTTFLDDPLRVLRAVRFTSRLQFTDVDPELLAAARNPTVQGALQKKISRERVSAELDGMLAIRRPILAFEMLHKLGLFNIIFEQPPENKNVTDVQFATPSLHLIRCYTHLAQHYQVCKDLNAEHRRTLLLALTLWPIGKLRYTVKGKPTPVSAFIIKQGLKGKVRDAVDIDVIHREAASFCDLVAAMKFSRKDAGLALRRCAQPVPPVPWLLAWLTALAVRLSDGPAPSSDALTENELVIVKSFEELRNRFEQEGLLGAQPCWELKPFVTGDELAALVKISPGPMFKEIVDRQIEFMLENPKATADDVIPWLKQQYLPKQ